MSTTTVTQQPAAARPMTVRETFRWIKETPAPYWYGEGESKGRFVTWVVVSMAAWTAVGIAGTALVGEGLRALSSLLG